MLRFLHSIEKPQNKKIKLTITENALSQNMVPSASACWLPCTMTETGKDNCYIKYNQ